MRASLKAKYFATGMPVHSLGAALFRFGNRGIAGLWVLGGLAGLDAILKKNRETEGRRQAGHR